MLIVLQFRCDIFQKIFIYILIFTGRLPLKPMLDLEKLKQGKIFKLLLKKKSTRRFSYPQK